MEFHKPLENPTYPSTFTLKPSLLRSFSAESLMIIPRGGGVVGGVLVNGGAMYGLLEPYNVIKVANGGSEILHPFTPSQMLRNALWF